MLSEWYFCCCIESNSDKTMAFLSILETLSNCESDSKLICLAYNELKLTEIWMQIYALPQVFESLHRKDLPKNIRSIVVPYFRSLTELIPEESVGLFNSLVELILSGAMPDDTIKNLQLCLQEIQRLPNRIATPTPYLDLKEFLPETLLLSVTFDQIIHNREFASTLSTIMEGEQKTSSFSQLLQNALDYQYGRLPFLLASRIARLVSMKYSKDKILYSICNLESSMVELEPDLLKAYAEVGW